jgi:hypothetical protein
MKLHTYKALHQRCISIEVIIGGTHYSLWFLKVCDKDETMEMSKNVIFVLICLRHKPLDRIHTPILGRSMSCDYSD